MALSNDVHYLERNGDAYDYPVLANVKLFGGGFTALTTAKAAVPIGHVNASRYGGYNEERVDNTGGATGDRTARLRRGMVLLVPLVAAVTDIGAQVYATDDNTLTLSNTGSPLQVATIHAVDSQGTWIKTL